MKNFYRWFILILLITFNFQLFAQLDVTNGSALGLTPAQLVQNNLVGQGVIISNVTYNGSSAVITSDQIGSFTTLGNAIPQLGLLSGVIMTSGKADIAIGPNNVAGATGNTPPIPGDPDLNILAGVTTQDKCVLEFDFIPQFDTVKFRYVFGSEEFYEFCNSYNDSFGFFLSGPGITGTFSNSSINIAKMPDSNNPVTINNICADATSNWNNAGGLYFQYDGLTHVFTAWHIVTPCTTYHIKLAIADALDHQLDSGVFLEKGSFSSSSLLVNNNFSVPKLGNKAVEGCSEATITFQLGQALAVPYVVNYTILGDATNCVDYDCLPPFVVIPPGDLTTSLTLHPIQDALSEGTESVVLAVQTPSCTGTTIFYDTLLIYDNTPLSLTASNDTTSCYGDSVTLRSYPAGGQYPYQYTWSNGSPWPTTNVAPPVGMNNYSVVVWDICDNYDTAYVAITVKPLPVLANTPLLDTACSGVPYVLGLLSTLPGSTFTWTASCPSPTITGYSGGSGPTISQTLLNSSLVSDTVTYHVRVTANGCPGPVTNMKVVVRPNPDAYFLPPGQNICSGQTTGISILSHVPGTNFTWTYTASSPNISGASNGAGSVIAQNLSNSGSTIDTVTYHVTPVGNDCQGNVFNVNVVVNPVPHVTNTLLIDTICSNTSTGINLLSNVTGATFSWNSQLISGSITGFSPGSGTAINQQLINGGIAIGKVIYRVTPLANTCQGPSTDFEVFVDPLPVITNSTFSYQICSNTGPGINLTANVTGTGFSWTVTAPPSITGSSAGSGSLLNQVLINTGFATDSVIYHVTPAFDGCPGTTVDFTVRVTPVADVWSVPVEDSICSGITTLLALNSHITGAEFAWTTTASSPNLSGFAPGTGDTISQTLANSGTTTETVTYHVSATANGCPPGPVTDVIVKVFPVPHVTTNPLIQAICNSTSTNINLTSGVTGTTFTWTATGSSANISGFSGGSGNTIIQTLTNTSDTNETVTYTIIPRANNCNGPPTNFTVTVYPTPLLSNLPLSKGICNNLNTNVSLTSNVNGALFTWTCTPSSGNISGYSDNLVPTTNLDQVLHIIVNYPETVTYHITPQINTCPGVMSDFVVTVNPRPHLTNNPMHDSICSGDSTNIFLTASCAGTTFSWTASVVTGNVTGFSSGAGFHIHEQLVNLLPTTGEVLYVISPVAAGCYGNDTNYFVYIKPTPHLINNPATDSICSGTLTNVILQSDVSGTSFSWTASPSSPGISGFADGTGPVIAQTLVNSGNTVETVTYHVTPHGSSCDGPVTEYVITVFPVPGVTFFPPGQAICSGQPTNIALSSLVTGTSFSWTATPGSANVTGFSASNGTVIAQVLTNSGTVNETVTYHVTPDINGCQGQTLDVVATVYPVPHVTTAPLLQTICSGNSIAVSLTSSVAGSTFSWTCSPGSPNLTGFSAGSGNLISQSVTNTGYTIESVTYHIIPAANACAGPITDYTLTVNPVADVSNNPAASQICSGNSPNVNLTSNVLNTTFAWTATGSSPNITGYSPGSGNVINQVLTNSGFSLESVTYHISPTANGCTGTLKDYIVSIVSIPDVYFQPPAQTMCSEQTTSIQNLSHVTGTIFTWTATGTPNVTGYGPGTGNIIQQILANTGTTNQTVTYTVTPQEFGCPAGVAQNVTVTIKPKPVITNAITLFQVCSQSIANILLQSNVINSTFSWTATGSSPGLSGFSGGSGPVISQTLVNSGFTIDTVTYSVTPVASGCNGNTVNFNVIVFPVSDAFFTPPSQTLCSQQSASVQIQSNVAGTTFTWTASGSSPNVTGFLPGAGTLIQQTLVNSGYNVETVTYHVSPVANGCAGTLANAVVTVDPLPFVTFNACFDPVTTTNAKPIRLKGSLPLGGIYSGPGVTGGFFDPALAGPGLHTINFSYINGFGCNSQASGTINVIAAAPFTCGSILVDIRDSKQYPTIQFNTQCWMAANLNYGTGIHYTSVQRDNCQPEKFCYQDMSINCSTDGGLYQWDEMMQYETAGASQGFCPPGWHVPTEAEWSVLFDMYNGYGFAGSPLKYSGFSGFNAFLVGVLHQNVSWNFANFATMIWSSSLHGTNKAWAHGMNSFDPSVSYYPSLRSNAFSVRCLKD
jgi:uncharacterized protein (TIGR02145 family)